MASTTEKINGIATQLTPSHHHRSPVTPVEKTIGSNNLSEIVWRNVIVMIFLHLSALYGFYLALTGELMVLTLLFNFVYAVAAAFGIGGGVHRYWAHKSFKATTPLRIIMAMCQTASCQNSIHEWCRDHRVHHKFTESNADPHNAKRGFFFAHVGWLLTKKHEDVKVKGRTVDLSDLEADPIVMFQKKYFVILTTLMTFVIPTVIPWLIWGENFGPSYFLTLLRYTLSLNFTWFVNSAAHLWGKKPYDSSINPVENVWVTYLTGGEGWHNYHHVFPWDYRAGEIGPYKNNFTATNIDRFARIGWAYDLKTVPETIVRQRVARTGDGSHDTFLSKRGQSEFKEVEQTPWGWGDPSIPPESFHVTQTLHKKQG